MPWNTGMLCVLCNTHWAELHFLYPVPHLALLSGNEGIFFPFIENISFVI